MEKCGHVKKRCYQEYKYIQTICCRRNRYWIDNWLQNIYGPTQTFFLASRISFFREVSGRKAPKYGLDIRIKLSKHVADRFSKLSCNHSGIVPKCFRYIYHQETYIINPIRYAYTNSTLSSICIWILSIDTTSLI